MATRELPAQGRRVIYLENGERFIGDVLRVHEPSGPDAKLDLLVYMPGRGWREEHLVPAGEGPRGWVWPVIPPPVAPRAKVPDPPKSARAKDGSDG